MLAFYHGEVPSQGRFGWRVAMKQVLSMYFSFPLTMLHTHLLPPLMYGTGQISQYIITTFVLIWGSISDLIIGWTQVRKFNFFYI
jgi:hypothetical protein